jgi:hypothetical protein
VPVVGNWLVRLMPSPDFCVNIPLPMEGQSDPRAFRDKVLWKIDSGELEATCAFCGTRLRAEAPGSLAVEVGSTRVDASQVMFVHAACLAEKLDESFPFEAELFEPDF